MDKKAGNKRLNTRNNHKSANTTKKINKKDITGQKARNKKRKRKTWKIVLLIILVILLIAGGIFAYIFFCTDLLLSEKQGFGKYVMQLGDKEEGFITK